MPRTNTEIELSNPFHVISLFHSMMIANTKILYSLDINDVHYELTELEGRRENH